MSNYSYHLSAPKWDIDEERISPTVSNSTDSNFKKKYLDYFQKKDNSLSIFPSSEGKVERIEENQMPVTYLKVSNKDTIIITFNIEKCSMEDVKAILRNYQVAFPNNNIVANFYPSVKSIEIIQSREEEEPSKGSITW